MVKNGTALRKFTVLLLAASITAAFSGMSTLTAQAATVKPSKISVKSTLKMTTADPAKLSVKVYPSKAKAKLTYKSSNTKIVKVSKTGKLTGMKLGKTTVTVKTKSASGKTLSKKVKVTVGICDTTKASEVKSYASDTNAHTILIDARSADAYSGWAVDGATVGGHLSNAVNFSADWLNADYDVDTNAKHLPAPENKTVSNFLSREIKANSMTKSNSYIVYDTNGKDAKKVATYLINKKGFRSVCTYNAKSLINNKEIATTSYKNYNMYVPASVVKNLSDNVVNGTALNDTSKALVGDSKNIVILHVQYYDKGKYASDGSYNADAAIDWTGSAYESGHVPGAIPASTDDFEPMAPTDRVTSTSYMLRHTADGSIDDAKLISLVERYGITKDSCVIVTGLDSTLAEARIAVILKYLGVENTHIMTGLLKTWKADGYALETGINTATTSDFGATKALAPQWIDTTKQFAQGLQNTSTFQGVDTRTKAEWDGLSSGYSYHDLAGRIAGTKFAPSGVNWNSSIYNYENPDYTMRSASEIEALWKTYGVDTSKHVSFFCGSGWRVSEILWDAQVMGYTNTSIYSDGWQGWSNAGLPFIDDEGYTMHYDSATKTVVEGEGTALAELLK